MLDAAACYPTYYLALGTVPFYRSRYVVHAVKQPVEWVVIQEDRVRLERHR